ncbi:alkene reductase [Accumulibacter sp.]|uniref:alkene reductase n=1 Tax=Accumulibacter sp. TaxID=2053492 RepID=UPI0025F0C0BF|nr:alkene reductase [Accumulibacter sp.]MCM8595529.1 alkene reductase [Accumulibacter sp.]MCM8625379.1 alkene reductase [Accumulibacter sp.]MDS4049676.1 alkene reductase [Accumulibacter sp.]
MLASRLLTPVRVGAVTAPNRIFMAPLTRQRAGQPGNVPTALNATYYAQRASAGLIVSEAAQVMPEGQGYAWTPGIHSDAQQAGWRLVSEAVHAAGGRIALQLWHVGRISHRTLQPEGRQPVAPSAVKAKAQTFAVRPDGSMGLVSTDLPRALDTAELPGVVAAYRAAGRRAMAAGFDLVEIHAANGYLLDQFQSTGTNQRSDAYGGSVANRARLTLEVVDALIAEVGAERTGIRISPFGTFNDISDSEAEAMAHHLATQFDARGLAYLHIAEPDWIGGPKLTEAFRAGLRERYHGVLVFAGGYTVDRAEALLAAGIADAIAFGRPFLANPDLPERFACGAPLNEPDAKTFYGGAEKGYTDYPTLAMSAGAVGGSATTG